ncbi:MAG: hypothetical protein KKE93_04950 [Nanoarchaeota archaeon]|nr:hypothetical protein [Nanoarchaeota archaeon]
MFFRKKRNPFLTVGILTGVFLGLFLGNILFWMIIGGLIGYLMEKKGFSHKGKIIDVKKPFTKIGSLIAIIVLILVLYFFRPWFHPFVMGLYTHPSIIFTILFALFCAFAFMKKKDNLGYGLLAVAFIFFIIFSLNEVIVERYIVSETEYHIISELPDSSQVRIVPVAVARRYAKDSLQKSREKLGDFDIVNLNNNLIWTTPRVPDGIVLYFTQKVKGLMTVNAEKSSRQTKMINQELKIGEDIGITDNINWKLYKKTYFMNLGEIYYIINDDEILTVAPVIKYKFRFPVMIPYFDGVYVVNPEAQIEKYSPNEINDIDYLKNNRAYPEYLARLYVDSYKYHLGVLNTWFMHKDQIEISDVYGQENRQPFLMPTVDGLKWILATEPYGESYGVFKIFVVDAVTGQIDMLEMDEDKTLTGPVRVVSYVKKQFPRIDWTEARIIEPRPYVVNGKLYWMLSITPADFAGISYTVFVDSENNDVLSFETDNDVLNFVSKGIITAEDKITEIPTKDKEEIIREIEEKLEELKELLEQEG